MFNTEENLNKTHTHIHTYVHRIKLKYSISQSTTHFLGKSVIQQTCLGLCHILEILDSKDPKIMMYYLGKRGRYLSE